MTRREIVTMLAAAGASGKAQAGVEADAIRRKMPKAVPPGIAAIIARTLNKEPSALNTDYFGTCLIEGMLEWAKRGLPECREFSKAWFNYHLAQNGVSPYSGNKSRGVNVGGIAITTYVGHFGLAYPCYELARQTDDSRARKICIDIADVILHQTNRNFRGMVGHDDHVEFNIPDVCYFVVKPLMIAYTLDRQRGSAYKDSAVYQLRAFTDTFLQKDTQIAKTILFKESGLGKSYWTRATGWLLWSMTSVLRFLPPSDPHFKGFVSDLNVLASGIKRHQDASGGQHLFVNDPSSPLEISGTAMNAMALHESVRKGWLPDSYSETVNRAWDFVRNNITDEGVIQNVYNTWAVPAESGESRLGESRLGNSRVGTVVGWAEGFMLAAANEMTLG